MIMFIHRITSIRPGKDYKHRKLSPVISTWTPKVCRIMAFMAVIRGLGLLFYILFGGSGSD